MFEQLKIQEILRKKFLEYKQRNPSFSIRSFAKILNMQPSAVNEIMKGERRVSIKLAKKIAERLLLSPEEMSDLLEEFDRKSNKNNNAPIDEKILQSNADNFEFISNWIYQATLLKLEESEDFNINTLQVEFGVSELEMTKAINRLKKMGLILVENNGSIHINKECIKVKEEHTAIGLKNMHLKDLELIREKIHIEKEQNLILENKTFLLDVSNINRARELIQQTHDELEKLKSESKSQQVFRVSSYLYPLSVIP